MFRAVLNKCINTRIRPRCGFFLLNLIEEKLENYKSYRIYSSLERKENKDGRSLNLFRAISIQCK